MKRLTYPVISWFLLICIVLVGIVGIPQVVNAGTTGNDPVFAISNLDISPAEASAGQNIIIGATIDETNNISGIYESTLKINGTVEESKPFSVGALGSKQITFTTSRDVAGVYSVDLDGLIGSFTVSEEAANGSSESSFPTAAIIGGIIGVVAVVGLLVFSWKKKKA
ncbi:hypothetical protein ACFLYB_05925 [Chloroflexota bacterium]